MVGRHSYSREGLTVGSTQVDVSLARVLMALHDGIEVKMGIGKGLHHLVAHLKT